MAATITQSRIALHQVNDLNTLDNRRSNNNKRLLLDDKIMIGPSLLPSLTHDKEWSSCENHAKRLKMRLKLAYFKVQTNQTRLSLTDLTTTTTAAASGLRLNGGGGSHNRTRSEPVILHPTTARKRSNKFGGSFSPFAKSCLATCKSSSLQKLPALPKSPSLYKTPKTAASATMSNTNSSPLRPKSLLSSAIKGTPNQMGAARSLLDLGCY